MKDAPAWQLELIFTEMTVRKFGFFGRLYNHRFQTHLYRNAATASRTLVYSLPLTRDGLKNWGMSGMPVLELDVLGMLMRPELRRFETELRALVRRARSRSKPAIRAVLEALAVYGIKREDITIDWNGEPHPEIVDARRVACQINVLRSLPLGALQAALEAAEKTVQDTCELSWSTLSVFDLETLRTERLMHLPTSTSESGGYYARTA